MKPLIHHIVKWFCCELYGYSTKHTLTEDGQWFCHACGAYEAEPVKVEKEEVQTK